MGKSINAHLPGIFYRRPDPSQPLYKEEGDEVKKDDVVGLIEVMKSFHEVKSPVSGVIKKILVENQSPVTAGQVIAEVE